jgi:haloalkane dehalogenase
VEILRTPDDRFENLSDFDYVPNYVGIDSGAPGGGVLRVHYVDDGPSDAAETLLLMHGEPSWAYLYRKMIPTFVSNGFRVVVPDLVGFGRSDKPADRNDYTYERHVSWMYEAVFDRLGLEDLTLVCHDWGGLIGLRLVAAEPDRFRRVVAANTGLPTGDARVSEALLAWQKFSQETPTLPVGHIINGATTTDLPEAVIGAYDAPFPDETYKEGARQFPILIPTKPDGPSSEANRQAWEILRQFDKPFLCSFSDKDPITKGADRLFLEQVPGCAGQPHTTIEGGGHFLQEDRGEQLAEVVTSFVLGSAAG